MCSPNYTSTASHEKSQYSAQSGRAFIQYMQLITTWTGLWTLTLHHTDTATCFCPPCFPHKPAIATLWCMECVCYSTVAGWFGNCRGLESVLWGQLRNSRHLLLGRCIQYRHKPIYNACDSLPLSQIFQTLLPTESHSIKDTFSMLSSQQLFSRGPTTLEWEN